MASPVAMTTKHIFFLSVVAASSLYGVDVASDAALAVKLLLDGAGFESGLTFGVVVVAWVALTALSYKEDRLSLWAACVGYPMYYWGVAVKELLFDKDASSASAALRVASTLRLFHVLLQSAPQFALQLYLAGRRNEMSRLRILVISSSGASVSLGIVLGATAFLGRVAKARRFSITRFRRTAFGAIFVTWTSLHLTTLPAPLAFYAASKSRPALYGLGVVYSAAHAALSATLSFATPVKTSKNGVVRFLRLVASVFLQAAFIGVSFGAVILWFGHAASILDAESDTNSSFVWRVTPDAVKKWAVNRTDVTPVYNATSRHFCLSRSAAPLLDFFVVAGVVLFVVHVVVVVLWPRILRGVFPEVDERVEGRREVTSRSGMEHAAAPLLIQENCERF